MRTTLNLPPELIKAALEVTGAKTKTQAIVQALTEMVQKEKSRQVLELKGSLKAPYDYKKSRRKR